MSEQSESDALDQYEYHRSERDRLLAESFRARRNANAHSQIMEGLARLYASVMREYREDANRRAGGGSIVEASNVSRSVPIPSRARLLTAGELREIAPPTLSGLAAVKEVLESHQGEFFTVAQLHELLLQDNLITKGPNSSRVLRNTLNRGVSSGSVVRQVQGERVLYAWAPALTRESKEQLTP